MQICAYLCMYVCVYKCFRILTRMYVCMYIAQVYSGAGQHPKRRYGVKSFTGIEVAGV
jgi:hypothetical protein